MREWDPEDLGANAKGVRHLLMDNTERPNAPREIRCPLQEAIVQIPFFLGIAGELAMAAALVWHVVR